jgi:transketolase
MTDYIPHQSERGYFAHEIYLRMRKNKRIWVVVGDLGYKMWDKIRTDYPDRFINTGASEQAMMGIAVGLALSGKIPIVYSISTFLLLRPFETIRNYIDYEQIPVKLVGSGREKDYIDDGISHWLLQEKRLFKIFNNIQARWPETKEEIPDLVKEMLLSDKPWYINLKR